MKIGDICCRYVYIPHFSSVGMVLRNEGGVQCHTLTQF